MNAGTSLLERARSAPMNAGTSVLAVVFLAVGLSTPWSAGSGVVIAISAVLALLPLLIGWRLAPSPAPPLSAEESPGQWSRPIPIHTPSDPPEARESATRIHACLPFSLEAPVDEPLARAARVLRG